MDNKLARKICVFGDTKLVFTIDDTIVDFEKRPSTSLYTPVVRYEDLFSHYGLIPSDFRERVANLTNPQTLENYAGEALNLNWVTSVDVLAARAGHIPVDSFFQLAAIGIVKTKDNQILVGVRGGEITPERIDRFASGLYGTPPGGSVKFQREYHADPIIDTVMDEFREELGYFDITSQELLGAFEAFKPGPTGVKFVSNLTTDATLEQIQEVNTRANQQYEHLLKQGATKEEAAQELRNRNLPPDAWEHSSIIGVYNHPRAIRCLVETQPQAGIGAGALLLYAESIDK